MANKSISRFEKAGMSVFMNRGQCSAASADGQRIVTWEIGQFGRVRNNLYRCQPKDGAAFYVKSALDAITFVKGIEVPQLRRYPVA